MSPSITSKDVFVYVATQDINFVFQQDNDPKQAAWKTKYFLLSNWIKAQIITNSWNDYSS